MLLFIPAPFTRELAAGGTFTITPDNTNPALGRGTEMVVQLVHELNAGINRSKFVLHLTLFVY
jgi:hypothetical protein